MTEQALTIEQPQKALTAADIKGNVQLVQQVMHSVMKENAHYGKFYNNQPKPTLYKAGSEVLLSTFRIAVRPDVEDLSDEDQIRYRVIAVGIHSPTGNVIGYGVGECSTNEEKYKWRGAICDAEYEDTDPSRRRLKYYKNGNKAKQVRTDPPDLANTVLKMAKKRAQIDLTLTATAASDIFDQDLDDQPPVGESAEPAAPAQAPRTQQAAHNGDAPPVNDAMIKMVRRRLEQKGVEEAALCKAFEINKVEDAKDGDDINRMLKWIAEQ